MSQHQDLIKRDLTLWRLGAALAAVVALLAVSPLNAKPLGSASSAPAAAVATEKTSKFKGPVGTQAPHFVNHGRLCSWHETGSKASQDSAPFGKSGFCHWTDDTRIGASCSCERTVEHAHEKHWGLVIEAPIGNGSSSSVH
jgi:hypothetical protein